MAKINQEEKDFLLESEQAGKKEAQEYVQAEKKEEKVILCPRCGKPLEEMNVPGFGYGYGHRKGKCKPFFEDEEAVMRDAQMLERVKESETEPAAAAKPVKEKPQAEKEMAAVVISEEESEEDLKKRLGLFRDQEEDTVKKEEKEDPILALQKEEDSSNKSEMPKLNAEKIRQKISLFTDEQDEELDKMVSDNEDIPAGTKKAIIIRKNVEKKEEAVKPQVKAEKKITANETRLLDAEEDEDEEDLGKTQLLTPPEDEIEFAKYPTLTDLASGEVIEITQPETTIGRSRKCQVQIADTVISHEHAHLILKNDKAYLRDDKSSNGTFILGEDEKDRFKLPRGLEVEIKSGSTIQFANRKYLFTMED